jgi:hypothetical protein
MPLVPYINQPDLNQALLHLLTFTTSSGDLRVVNNNEPITSRSQVYEAYPFSLTLPLNTAENQAELTLTIDNVDQRLVEGIRELLEPPAVKFEMILSNTPDNVEQTIDFLRADTITYDAMQIEAKLRPQNVMGRRFPYSRYTPSQFPDLAFR